MKHNEIETCVIGAKNGNKDDLLKVLDQYKPFIFKTARKFKIKNYDLVDLEQIGYMAIINALAKYRIGSCTFSTYVYESIKNALKYTARQNSKHEREFSLNSAIDPYKMTTEYINCLDSPENIEETILRYEESSELKKAVSKLPPHELELVLMIYYKGVTIKEYAAKKGISYYQASKKKDLVLCKLGTHFKN